MWVQTIVFSRPIRRATIGAASCDAAESSPVTKKNKLACPSDIPKRSNSQSASSALTVNPPAKASMLNRLASRTTTRREATSGAAGGSTPDRGVGSER